MYSRFLTPITTLAALALSWPVAGLGQAGQPSWGALSAGSANVQLATGETDAFTLGNIAGKPLRGSNQEELGSVSDFLVDPTTGQVHFAMVPSGAGASGETFRIVPMMVLTPAAGNDGFAARIDQAQWEQVGTRIENRLKGRITLNADELQRLQQQFGASEQLAATGELIRATELKGKSVRAGNGELGQIEDVVVDVQHRAAAALIKPGSAFGGANQKFLVPLQHLQISGDAAAGITTALTQADFQQARAALTPTGFTGALFDQVTPPVRNAVSAVQQAVQQSGGTSVQVTPETWVILRGTVENEQKRMAIENAAKQAAAGLPIDNKITVQP